MGIINPKRAFFNPSLDSNNFILPKNKRVIIKAIPVRKPVGNSASKIKPIHKKSQKKYFLSSVFKNK
mgnify:CR=1 FL=1